MSGESETNAGLRIILIEDDPLDAQLILERLRTGLDCQVVVVMTRPMLQAELARKLPDVIISDSSLPNLDSMAALDAVRAKYPEVPFIVCTGNDSPTGRLLATMRGAKAWVSKNDLTRLVDVVKRVALPG